MNKFYSLYINSQEWKVKREEIFQIKGRTCERCKSNTNIHIHHGSYATLGFEDIKHVFVLCRSCHDLFHMKYGVKDCLRATKSFIDGTDYIPRKKKIRMTKAERRARRIERGPRNRKTK